MAGRRPYTRELYTKLVRGFREAPGNGSAAARYAGCDPRTARRAWSHGWPNHPWAPPIERVIEKELADEKLRKAAILQETVDHDAELREKQRAELEAAREAELQMLRLARQNVVGCLAVSAKLTPAMMQLADLVAREATNVKSPDKALSFLAKHSGLMSRASNAADQILKLSRLDRGEATENLALVSDDEMTYEEALAELETAGELRKLLDEKHGVIEAEVSPPPSLPPGPALKAVS